MSDLDKLNNCFSLYKEVFDSKHINSHICFINDFLIYSGIDNIKVEKIKNEDFNEFNLINTNNFKFEDNFIIVFKKSNVEPKIYFLLKEFRIYYSLKQLDDFYNMLKTCESKIKNAVINHYLKFIEENNYEDCESSRCLWFKTIWNNVEFSKVSFEEEKITFTLQDDPLLTFRIVPYANIYYDLKSIKNED